MNRWSDSEWSVAKIGIFEWEKNHSSTKTWCRRTWFGMTVCVWTVGSAGAATSNGWACGRLAFVVVVATERDADSVGETEREMKFRRESKTVSLVFFHRHLDFSPIPYKFAHKNEWTCVFACIYHVRKTILTLSWRWRGRLVKYFPFSS